MRNLARNTSWILLGSLAGIISCIRPVELNDIATDEVLVIEGLITDEDKRHEIKVSITTPLSTTDSILPVGNATVFVLENDDDRIDFTESTSGVYTSNESFGGVAGRTYQLFVNLTEGRTYESSVVTMQATPEIDSIYATFNLNPINHPQGGDFEILIDSRANDTNTKYLRWTWQASSTLKVANPSRYEWLGGNDFVVRELGGDNSENQVEQCWINQPSTQVLVQEEPVEGLGFRGFQLHGFHSDTRAMSIDFGIEVKQYALSDESFTYWELLASTTQGSGFLFDRQVGSVQGNILNPENPEELVLGYFEAAEEKKLFRRFNHLEFGDAGFRRRSQFFVDCFDVQPMTSPPGELGLFLDEYHPDWQIAFFITNGPAVFYPERCSNCTVFGDNQRPDYWVE